MSTRKQWVIGIAASALCVSGCVSGEPANDGLAIDDKLGNELEESAPTAPPPTPFATIEDESGRVEWFHPEVAGDEPEMVITVNGEAAPIVHPDFAEKVGTVQAYLALVEEDAVVPTAFSAYLREDDREAIAETSVRRALRAENSEIRARITQNIAEFEDDGLIHAGCSSAQINSARNFYGAAYSAGGGSSGSKTCGQNQPFHYKTGTTYYCNIPGADCDYPLGGGGECDPNGCTTVAGKTKALRARWTTGPGGNSGFAHFGRRYRFGFKNCSPVYSATMRRRRGGGAWINTTISPGAMQVRVGGSSYPPPHALAKSVVRYGVWEEHWNWGTNADPLNQFEITAQTEGVFCGDIIQRFDTNELYSAGCNGGKHLCDDSTCSGSYNEYGCWD